MRKKSILVPGALILNSIPKLNKEFSIQALPSKLPIIVPGKPYTLHLNLYLELGGYLLNGVEYADEIILTNWELCSQSRILKANDIVGMVNKMNSVAFKINEDVFDFILLNNDKYSFLQIPYSYVIFNLNLFKIYVSKIRKTYCIK